MAAASLLGPQHPLADVLARCETARMRMLVLAGVHVAGLLLWWSRPSVGAAAVAGTVAAELLLGCNAFLLHEQRRTACRALIASGCGSVALASVAREQERLGCPRYQAQLARSIARLTGCASACDLMPTSRLPIDPRVRSETARELAEVGHLLGAHLLSAQAVAIVEQLLSSPGSPLYGTDSEQLKRELGRVRYLA